MIRPYIQSNDKSVIINNSYFVNELASIYTFPTYKKTNAIIGIASFGGGIYGTIKNNILTNGDVQKYWSLQGIDPNQHSTVYTYFVNGATNNTNDLDSTLENTLDISVVGSCCQCTIVLFVFPNSTAFSSAFATMLEGANIGGNLIVPTILSVSWGAPEIYVSPIDMTNTNTIIKNKNINVCVASGDFGSTDKTPFVTVDFPSSCPYVTALGGTTLLCPNKKYDSQTIEYAWNNGTYATGGGISKIFPKPSYQSSLPGNFRNVPDLALNSDPSTGIKLMYNNAIINGIGGTSLAAPLFAGFLALSTSNLSNSLPFINPLLYSNTSAFNDITIGNNRIGIKGYLATPGYDNCTGIGSLNGNKIWNNLITYVENPTQIILPQTTQLNIINTIQLVPVLFPKSASNKNIIWDSSNKNIATVVNGLIKPVALGAVVIKASYANIYAITVVIIYKNKLIYK